MESLKNLKSRKSQSGFTLVELSIVLVIIGLIISSVLVGQDLVRSAELRATITQLESFNSAVGTFRGKYNGLPGDIKGAANYGFTGDGNNDGVLPAAGTATALAGTTEDTFFWNHLGSSSAALISGSYLGNQKVDATTSATTGIAANLPSAKAGNYWGVFGGPAATIVDGGASTSEAGFNYYILGVTGDTAGSPTGTYTTTATLTPLEAQNIDTKMDDGKPSAGIVRARGAATDAPDILPTNSSSTSTSVCIKASATATVNSLTTFTAAVAAVNTYQTTATTALCNLRFRMPL